jgi:hypothetical protein
MRQKCVTGTSPSEWLEDHPPGDPQAVFGRGEDPYRSGRPAGRLRAVMRHRIVAADAGILGGLQAGDGGVRTTVPRLSYNTSSPHA